ncbi:ATP-grasp domain-containing protein [Oceanirhabdus sp. W0125-5]|nr:ATP-grasp domain-containing protein [Oceanirhabdus sp. W0125-5]WBW99775.1 ATP-grasp domain-containing protein [Oceanirhabdus sp. W0125-5]
MNGKFVLTLVREKLLTSLPYRQEVGYISPARIDNNIFKLIEQEVNIWCEILKLNNCVIHVDLIINNTYDNAIIPIEISGRPSGLMRSSFMTPYSTGINFCRMELKCN